MDDQSGQAAPPHPAPLGLVTIRCSNVVPGDDDAVAPMSIPQSLTEIIPKDRLTFKTLPGAGVHGS